MKKLITLTFTAVLLFTGVPFAQAKTVSENTNSSLEIQQKRNRQVRQNRRYNNRSRVRTYYQTRYVRRGRVTYKEVYRVRILPNGKRQVKLVSRTIVRRYRNGRYN